MNDATLPAEEAYRLEILDDDFTPMDFVVDTLMRHMAMDWDSAAEAMTETHTTGSALVGRGRKDVMEVIAQAIVAEARSLGHPLLVSAVPAMDRAGDTGDDA